MAYFTDANLRCFQCHNRSCSTVWQLRADQYVMITLTNLQHEHCYLFARCQICKYITVDIIDLEQSLHLVELGTVSLHYPLDPDRLEMIAFLTSIPDKLTEVHCDLAAMLAFRTGELERVWRHDLTVRPLSSNP